MVLELRLTILREAIAGKRAQSPRNGVRSNIIALAGGHLFLESFSVSKAQASPLVCSVNANLLQRCDQFQIGENFFNELRQRLVRFFLEPIRIGSLRRANFMVTPKVRLIDYAGVFFR